MAIDPDFAGLFAGWPFSGLTPAPTPDPSQGSPIGLLAPPPPPPIIGSPSDLACRRLAAHWRGLGASLDPMITAPSPFASFKAGGLGSLGYARDDGCVAAERWLCSTPRAGHILPDDRNRAER